MARADPGTVALFRLTVKSPHHHQHYVKNKHDLCLFLTAAKTWATLLCMQNRDLATAVYKLVGRAVAEERRRRNPSLSQHALATRTNGALSRSAIANIESGRQRVAVHHLYELAQALQVEPSKLIPPLDRVLELLPLTDSVLAADPAAREFTERVLGSQNPFAPVRGDQRR